MSWARLDDRFFLNGKVRKVAPMAKLLDVAAICFCSQAENDGHFVAVDVQMIALSAGIKSPGKLASELVSAGLWDKEVDAYVIHDYLEYNPSHEELQAKRKVNSKRAELRSDAYMMGRIKKRDEGKCRYCGVEVDWKDHRGSSGGTYDHVVPLSRGGETTDDNIVVSCRFCNSKKGDRLLSELGIYLLETGKLPVGITGKSPVSPSPPLPDSLSLPLSASDPNPDQTRVCARSNPPANQPGKPSPRNVVAMFLRIRAEVLQVQPFANPTESDVEKAAAWLASSVEPSQVGQIEPAIRLAVEHVRDGVDGWNGQSMTKIGLLWGSIIRSWYDLLEELAGCAPVRAAPRSKTAGVDEWLAEQELADREKGTAT